MTAVPRSKKLSAPRPWRTRDGIRIRPLKTRTGNYSYRVEVPESITGTRILKQFKTTDEAEAYASVVVIQRANHGLAAFSLSEAQRADARGALELLGKVSGATLTAAAEFFVKHHAPLGGDISVTDLVDRYLAEKSRAKLREDSLRDLASRLGIFRRTFGERLVKDIPQDEIKNWLFADPSLSDQTRLNYRTILHGFFERAVKEKFLAINPISEITIKVEREEPGILSLDQVACLLHTALGHPELGIGSYLTLGLFCGIRHKELCRLDWADIRLTERFVTISKRIAKKRRIRNIPLELNTIRWLRAFGVQPSGSVAPESVTNRLTKLRKLAERKAMQQRPAVQWFETWPPNALRHSFASYFFAMTSNGPETCARLGQRSDEVLFQHYRSLVKQSDGKRFFELKPPVSAKADKVIPMIAAQAA